MEAEKQTYSLRFGRMPEILGGLGREAANYEDLYCSSREAGQIFVPQFVGVFQGPVEPDCGNEFDTEIIQMLIENNFGRRDKVHPSLTCVVYDLQAINKFIVQEMIVGDALRRIKIAGYDSVPDFRRKTAINPVRIGAIITRGRETDDKKLEKTLLERERDILGMTKQKYGLTREEALVYEDLKDRVYELENGKTIVKAFRLPEQ